MARHTILLGPFTEIHYGKDRALEFFIDITDTRFTASGKDEQGEGYIMEWSKKDGFSTNYILANVAEINLPIEEMIVKIKPKVESFIDLITKKF
jgi:hypothetical protein